MLSAYRSSTGVTASGTEPLHSPGPKGEVAEWLKALAC